MESKGHILHWSLNPLSLQGDWDVFGFEKISLWNLLGDIFSRRCNSFTLKKMWVHGGWRDPQTGPYRVYRDPQTGIYKGLAYNGHSSSHQV